MEREGTVVVVGGVQHLGQNVEEVEATEGRKQRRRSKGGRIIRMGGRRQEVRAAEPQPESNRSPGTVSPVCPEWSKESDWKFSSSGEVKGGTAQGECVEWAAPLSMM
jgi:hypothetical protein